MGQFHRQRLPNETENYRAARDRLLGAEKDLRVQVEKVAALRRELPRGGLLKQDYVFEGGEQLPIVNVFQKTEDGIYHCYASELFFLPSESGQNPRHIDNPWPLWNLLDLMPEGRGTDWYPRYDYD